MVRRRRTRRTSIWPIGLVASMAVIGLWVGAGMSGSFAPDGPARTLEPEEGVVDDRVLPSPWDRVRVEVLNAGGISGAASEAKDLLRDAGFDVVYFGNASNFGLEDSEVLDRTGATAVAEALARHIQVAEVRYEPDPTRLVDITVLIGADWNEVVRGEGSGTGVLSPGEPDDGALSRWWDLRDILERFDRVR